MKTAITIEPVELVDIANRIRSRLKRTVADILATGADLIAAKERLPHGKFGPWITTEFGMTDRTARNFMQAAAWATSHELKSETISDLPQTVIYQLSSPTTPKEIQTEVAEKIKTGSPVDIEQVEVRIGVARAEARRLKHDQRRRRKKEAASPAVRRRLEQQDRQVAETTARREAATAEAAAILRRLEPADLQRLVELMKDGIWFHDIAKAALPGRVA